jgi:hypothetical protein
MPSTSKDSQSVTTAASAPHTASAPDRHSCRRHPCPRRQPGPAPPDHITGLSPAPPALCWCPRPKAAVIIPVDGSAPTPPGPCRRPRPKATAIVPVASSAPTPLGPALPAQSHAAYPAPGRPPRRWPNPSESQLMSPRGG